MSSGRNLTLDQKEELYIDVHPNKDNIEKGRNCGDWRANCKYRPIVGASLHDIVNGQQKPNISCHQNKIHAHGLGGVDKKNNLGNI